MRRRALLISIALSLAACSATCRERDGHARRTQADIDLDNRLTAKVRENLTANAEVRATDIGVATFQLVVTLDGHVRSEAERFLAIKIAADTQVADAGGPRRPTNVEARRLSVKAP
jgi:osmotically-inducible protein OsmY